MRQSIPKLARNAFEVLGNLPRHGVGSKLTRKTWQDNSFWTVTEIKTGMDGKTGKAYGILTWRGQQQSEQPSRINGTSKKVWKTLTEHQEQKQQWESLAAAALRTEAEAATATSETAEGGTTAEASA